jgi:anaerobic magnesium-protoporphyrin IX monomethyl ester cyclase
MSRNNFRVLLVSFFNTEAYGLRQLHSILYNEGYDVKMLFLKGPIEDSFSGSFNCLTDKEEEYLKSLISQYNPHLIAFSLVSSNFNLYKRIYKRICGMGDFKVIVGGWQASLNPGETIHWCDMLCVGEGEEMIKELVDKLYNNRPINKIRNLWLREGEKITRNPVRPLISNLSNFPIPIFENDSCYFIENNSVAHKDPYMENSRYGTIIGRGCPFRCTYCSNSFMANIYDGLWGRTRYRSIDHLMLELNEVKRRLTKVNRINFYDEVFMQKTELVGVFAERYKKEIAMPFYCMFYPGACKEETAGLLKSAGLAGVWLGVQSGSERVRKEVFKRYHSNDAIIKQAKIFKAYDIGVKYDFILDNPFESFDESLESIALMLEFPEPFLLNLFSLKYFPNTEITSMALKSRIISAEELNDRLTEDHQNYLVVKGNKDNDREFINSLAEYISFLASKSRLKNEKKAIEKLINNYRINRDVGPIIGLLKQVNI